MPIYDYRCGQCGKVTEVFRHMGHENPPDCCGTDMVKVPGVAMVKYKGEGGFPSRKKWFDNWRPDTPNLSIGSVHGQRY